MCDYTNGLDENMEENRQVEEAQAELKFVPQRRPRNFLGPVRDYFLRSTDQVKLSNLNNLRTQTNPRYVPLDGNPQDANKAGIMIPSTKPLDGGRVAESDDWKLAGLQCYAMGYESLFHVQFSLKSTPKRDEVTLDINFRECDQSAGKGEKSRNLAEGVDRWSMSIRLVEKGVKIVDRAIQKDAVKVKNWFDLDTSINNFCPAAAVKKCASPYKYQSPSAEVGAGECDVVVVEIEMVMKFKWQSSSLWNPYICFQSFPGENKARAVADSDYLHILETGPCASPTSSKSSIPSKRSRLDSSSTYSEIVALISAEPEKKTFNVYKSILCAQSPEFTKKLASSKTSEMEIQASGNALQLFLDILHMQEMGSKKYDLIPRIEATVLLQVFHLIQTFKVSISDDLHEEILSKSDLTVIAALKLYGIGLENNIPTLSSSIIQYLKKNWALLKNEERKKSLAALSPDVAASIISDLLM